MFSFRLGIKEMKMRKLLLTCTIASAGFLAFAGTSYADLNEALKESKYCTENSFDPACMGPESLAMRTNMMAMTKDKAMESRKTYCEANKGSNDPICEEKMMNDVTGYN